MTTNQIPAGIKLIIDEELQRIQAENETKMQNELREREAKLKLGRQRVEAWLAQQIARAPQAFQHHFAYINTDRDIELVYLDNSSDDFKAVYSYDLVFEIPGLAPLVFYTQKGQWGTATASRGEYDTCAPSYSTYRNGVRRIENIETLLATAMQEAETFEQYTLAYEESVRQTKIALEQEEAREVACWNRSRQETAARQSEEQALFDAIKNDPIAIHMLKAFVLLRDERSTFEQHIDEADESLYSMENRWSRRVEDLRRQASDIERRAEEEKSRLRNDLDDAEAKLVKAQRNQNGW